MNIVNIYIVLIFGCLFLIVICSSAPEDTYKKAKFANGPQFRSTLSAVKEGNL